MDKAQVRQGISKSWTFLCDLGIGLSFSTPTPLPVNDEFRDLVLSSKSTYADAYRLGLAKSHYNISLSDYSFLQFSISGQDHVRYAYYPNPFLNFADRAEIDFTSWQEEVENGAITFEDFHSILRDMAAEMRIPLVRYENAPSQYKCLHHPCSHFHIGFHAESRWPISRVLTPESFTMLIAKLYYSLQWQKLGVDANDKVTGSSFESMLIAEKANCRIIGNELFGSNTEARSFHFA